MPYREADRETDGIDAVLNGCLIWTGRTTAAGSPVVRMRDGNTTPMRRAWEKANGRRIPKGKEVLKLCGNTLCVNPQHGEPVNAREREYRRGRTKLREDEALTAYRLGRSGWSHRDIARFFGVSPRTAGRIMNGQYGSLQETIKRGKPRRESRGTRRHREWEWEPRA